MTTNLVQVDTLADPIVVNRQVFREQEQIGIRYYYRSAGTGELLPGRHGINIPVQFAAAVHKALGDVLGVNNAKKAAGTKKATRTKK